jgi:cytidine deaminase
MGGQPPRPADRRTLPGIVSPRDRRWAERVRAVGPDWDALRELAVAACNRAYAPYSRYPVGVAGLVDDGRVLTACNVENASYGCTLCAECGLVSALHATGGGRLVAVACVDGAGRPLVPCGRCRQVLHEHGGPELLFNERPLGELLPDAFGPDHLGGA